MAIDKVKLPDNSVEEVRDSRITGIDSAPTSGSGNLVTSGGVKVALDGYLSLSGGTMTNTNLVTNLNADLLDGKHASDFIGVNDNAASATVIKETTLEDEEFAYQATPVHDIADAYRIDRIKGRTLAWNQLVDNGNFAINSFWNGTGATITIGNNTLTAVSGEGSNNAVRYSKMDDLSPGARAGHRLLFTFDYKSDKSYNIQWPGGAQAIPASDAWTTASFIGSGREEQAYYDYIYFYNYSSLSAGEWTLNLRNVNIIDLTLMFGAGNEPSTVAEFEALFPLPYYGYNEGELISVAAEGIETVGFNLFDEGIMSGWDGITRNADGWSGALNKFWPHWCFENTFNYTGRVFLNVNYSLDGGTGFLSAIYVDGTYNDFRLDPATRATVGYETPAGKVIEHIEFSYVGSGTLTIHSLCINLSDASRNGTYEPHWSKVLPLGLNAIKVKDSQGNIITVNGLASAGDVRDEIRGGKYTERVGRVDLGTLDWGMQEQGGFNRFNAANISPEPKNGTYWNFSAEINSKGYDNNGAPITANNENMSMGYYSQTRGIYIRDDAYSTVEAFAAAMSGVYLYYELATPVEYDLVAPMPFSGKIDGYGTMRVISDNIVAPFNGDITYGCNPGQIAADSNALMEYVNSVFDLRYYETSQPSGGMLPNREYQLGTLSGNTTFTLASGTSGVTNHYFWSFDTGSTAPTITWPSGITSWYGGSAPTINASKHYEVSVLDGVAICMEV